MYPSWYVPLNISPVSSNKLILTARPKAPGNYSGGFYCYCPLQPSQLHIAQNALQRKLIVIYVRGIPKHENTNYICGNNPV